MKDCVLGDAFRFDAQKTGDPAAVTHLKLLDRIVNGARFLTGGLFECDIAQRRSVAVLCMLYIRSGVTEFALFMVLYLGRMCRCGWLWSHIRVLIPFIAAEPRSTTGPLFPFQCPYGTILLTLCSMVWDWPVSRAMPILFYGPKLASLSLLAFVLLFFPFTSFCV